ncbi:hypothetical protein MRX96_045807 [Rhipicephalus microplus]
MMAGGHLQPPAAATATIAEEADSGLSTLRSAAALDSAEEGRPTDCSTPLPSLSSETVSLRNRSSSSATPSLHDHDDSLDSNTAGAPTTASTVTAAGGHVNGPLLTSRPPLPVRSTSKASDRSVQSLPPSFGESKTSSASSSSANGMVAQCARSGCLREQRERHRKPGTHGAA